MKQKILIEASIYRSLNNEAKKRQLTADELTEIIIKGTQTKMRTRSKEASIQIADRVSKVLEGLMVIGLLHQEKVARDEPGESDNNPDVRRHNQYVAQQLKQRKNKEAARKRMIDRGIVPKNKGNRCMKLRRTHQLLIFKH